MASITMRFTRKQRALANAPVVKKEISAALNGPVKKHFVKEFEKRVSDWKGKPGFPGTRHDTANALVLRIAPAGANANKWLWTSRGTKKHTIAARRAPLLVFRLGYNAKTQPPDQYGVGSGKATGEWARAREVMHPGTKARKFEEGIVKKETSWYVKEISAAFRRGIRAMQKG